MVTDRPKLPPILDAQIQAGSLAPDELRDLAWFGVVGAVLVASEEARPRTGKEAIDLLARVPGAEAARFARAGVTPFVALGLPPRALPARGLAEVLARLPAMAGARRVVAVGAIGLEDGGPAEEEALRQQLAIADEISRPVVVHTPERDKPRATRRILAILRESGLDPRRCLVGPVDDRTIRLVRECGHLALLAVNPSRLRPEAAVSLVKRLGSTDLCLASAARAGAGDLLALPRTAARLAAAGLSDEIVRRVCLENARAFYGIEPEALGG